MAKLRGTPIGYTGHPYREYTRRYIGYRKTLMTTKQDKKTRVKGAGGIAEQHLQRAQ